MPRSARALFLSVMVGTLALRAKAQICGANGQSPIATDRPQITSSSIVVPCGSLQFENGFQEVANGGQRSFDFPETSVRFGIANKTELRFGVPDYFHNDDTASGFASGAGDLILGFKQQLGPTRGGFDVSLIPFVSFPTGAKSISSGGYDPTVQLPWSRSLAKNWTAAGMFSRMWPTGGARRNLTGQSSISLYWIWEGHGFMRSSRMRAKRPRLASRTSTQQASLLGTPPGAPKHSGAIQAPAGPSYRYQGILITVMRWLPRTRRSNFSS
jgi:hypothetical protein